MSTRKHHWTQAGHVYWWRYPKGRRAQAGHHLTADLAGAQSMAALLRALLDGDAAMHRTVALTRPPVAISAAAGFGEAVCWEPGRLRIEYVPSLAFGDLSREDERITMRIGRDRLEDFWSGFVEIEIGGGDFAVTMEEAGEQVPLWFWWRPDSRR